MEKQMDELKAFLSSDGNEAFQNDSEKKSERLNQTISRQNQKNIELAKLYNDAYEYEQELAAFEAELEIVEAYNLQELATALTQKLPNENREYEKELHGILIATWQHKVEVLKTHPKEQLEVIKMATLLNVIEILKSKFPTYEGDFTTEIKASFIDRLKTLIAIKKEHIDEEISELKIAGLKPSFVKRIHKQVNKL